MTMIYMFYDYLDLELKNKMETFGREIHKYKQFNVMPVDTHYATLDVINKVYKFDIKNLPAIVVSINDYIIFYTDELSVDKFMEVFNSNKKMYLMQDIDLICSNLRSTASRAFYNNRSDYIEDANNAISDIISLVYAQKDHYTKVARK